MKTVYYRYEGKTAVFFVKEGVLPTTGPVLEVSKTARLSRDMSRAIVPRKNAEDIVRALTQKGHKVEKSP